MTDTETPGAPQARTCIRRRGVVRLAALWHGIYPGKLWEFLLFGTLAVLVGWLWYWAYFNPPKIIIEDVTIPKQLQNRGFSGHFLAGRIADEIRNIQRVARTTKFPISTGTSESAPDIEVRATVFTLGSIMSFVRETLGTGDHIVTASLYCGQSGLLSLSLQGSYSHEGLFPEDVAHLHILDQTITIKDGAACAAADLVNGIASGSAQPEQADKTDRSGSPRPSTRPADQTKKATVAEPGKSVDQPQQNPTQRNTGQQEATFANLPKCAAQAIIKAFDPFFLAAYHYERAKYYAGIELLNTNKLLEGGPPLIDAYGITKISDATARRAAETIEGFQLIKYCLGLDTSGEANDTPDERHLPYDRHTRVRALNLWGLFDVLHVGMPEHPSTAEDDKKFEQAENRFAEAVQLAASDPKLKRELAFVYANWAAIHYAWKGIREKDRQKKQDAEIYSSRLFEHAIQDGDIEDGRQVEGEILLDAKKDDYSVAGKKLAASIRDHQGGEDQDEAETIKELGDTLMRVPAASLKQIEKAIKLYRKAIDTDASLASPYVVLSAALDHEHELEKPKPPDLLKDLAEPHDALCRALSLYRAYPDELPDVALFRPAEFHELAMVRPGKISQICDGQIPDGATVDGSQTGTSSALRIPARSP